MLQQLWMLAELPGLPDGEQDLVTGLVGHHLKGVSDEERAGIVRRRCEGLGKTLTEEQECPTIFNNDVAAGHVAEEVFDASDRVEIDAIKAFHKKTAAARAAREASGDGAGGGAGPSVPKKLATTPRK